MAHSIREQLLQTLMTLLAPIAAAEGATLLRSPVQAISREQSPALLLFPESDTITDRYNDRLERHLIVRLVALAREGNAPAETLADRLLVAAHATLMRNMNLGGLALGIQELDGEWEFEDADATAAALPTRYQITYRTLAADISQPG